MPIRKIPLVTGEIYHVFNRSVDRKPIFHQIKYSKRAIQTLNYYRYACPPTRLSHWLRWSADRQTNWLTAVQNNKMMLVEILAFCLMPNHFHLLIKQRRDDGISHYLSKFQNSFTHYYNTMNKRTGHVFQGQFKAVRIESDEQLIHVSRYIHLNPYSSHILKDLDALVSYPWSSFAEYTGSENGFTNNNIVMNFFKSEKDYKKFVLNQADYQRSLEAIKHLCLDSE